MPPPPPWLVGSVLGLDLSAVPDGLWLAIRQYLTRMQQLDPQVGWAMAERLAGDLAARTGAPAPQGVPPAAYLAAVVQERQAREVAPGHFAVAAAAARAAPSSGRVRRTPPIGAGTRRMRQGSWAASGTKPSVDSTALRVCHRGPALSPARIRGESGSAVPALGSRRPP